MTLSATYPIRLTSAVNEFSPPFIPRGVVIANYSADNLAFDNTVDPVLLIPPGVVVPIAIGHLVSTLRIRSASNTTGTATIRVMDSEPDITHAPNLQQLPGTITATIPSTITTQPAPGSVTNINVPAGQTIGIAGSPTFNIAAGQSVGITGNPTIQVAAGQTIGIAGSPTFNIAAGQSVGITGNPAVVIHAQDIQLDVADTLVRGNTTSLLGLLTNNKATFSLTSGQSAQMVAPSPLAGFGLTATITGAGRLNVWVLSGTDRVYLVRNRGFYASPIAGQPVEKRFPVPIAQGDSINVSWDDATTSAAFVARY